MFFMASTGISMPTTLRQRVHKAIANFKPVPGFDAEALIRFFKMQ